MKEVSCNTPKSNKANNNDSRSGVKLARQLEQNNTTADPLAKRIPREMHPVFAELLAQFKPDQAWLSKLLLMYCAPRYERHAVKNLTCH